MHAIVGKFAFQDQHLEHDIFKRMFLIWKIRISIHANIKGLMENESSWVMAFYGMEDKEGPITTAANVSDELLRSLRSLSRQSSDKILLALKLGELRPLDGFFYHTANAVVH